MKRPPVLERFDMKTTIPVPVLKSRAKALARQDAIPLSRALDQVAQSQGFAQWSLLAAQSRPADNVFSQLVPGDLALLGGRPGKGKTLMGLGLVLDAIRTGATGMFFTLECTPEDVVSRIRQIGADPAALGQAFVLDTSDEISADHILRRVSGMPPGTLVVVDYMQLLDQRRANADLATQVAALRACAKAQGLIIVLISQIDRNYDPALRPIPDMSDVRLPNPLDLTLFTKTCFVGDGGMQVTEITPDDVQI